jgi:tryptophanyl-tRNA synthetase
LPGRDGAEVLIANYHAPQETNLEELVKVLNKFGVNQIRMQRDVFNAELYFRLLSIAGFGDLARMPQFKSADEDKQTGQLLTYPVLMTHDVVGYENVLVGEDQKVHLEYARRLIRKYNKTFNEEVVLPRPMIVGGKVKDLRKPTEKMSKSSPDGCLFLDDTPDDIRTKLKAATTTPEGIENLSTLYTHFVGPTVPSMNSELKSQLADALIEAFK